MKLILFSKPGCHLCEGLYEKLEQVSFPIELEVRDITMKDEWFQAFQYEIPVLYWMPSDADASPQRLPRLSPRASVEQVEQMLQTIQADHQAK
jgi:hypothetical protein